MGGSDIFDDAPIGMAQVSLEGRLLTTNRQFCDIVGYRNTDLARMTFQEITHPEDLSGDVARVAQLLARGRGCYFMEKRYIRSDGKPTWVDLNVSMMLDAKSRPTAFLSTISEINAKKERENALAGMAYTDVVTGLPNRNGFETRLDKALVTARKTGLSLALILLDLDGFKPVNDTHGHQAGDAVLREVGGRLNTHSKGHGFAARLGGDEFVYVIEKPQGVASPDGMIAQITALIEEPILYEGTVLHISASAGCAVFPDHARTVSELLHMADLSMYRMKELKTAVRRSHCRRSLRSRVVSGRSA